MTDETKGQGDATRCGFVALIGAPNVGKSTLVNALVGSKVTIVSRKVQTTRALIRGIVIEGNAQIILVDTPGIFAPRRRLDRAMVSTAWSGAHDADLVCVLLDAKSGIDEEANAILARSSWRWRRPPMSGCASSTPS
jgi:GTP-binding protein Era